MMVTVSRTTTIILILQNTVFRWPRAVARGAHPPPHAQATAAPPLEVIYERTQN
jgi:hypothetical protein